MATIRQAIETRIKDQLPQLKQVAGAASIQAVLSNSVSTPACYVFLENESIKSNNDTLPEHEALYHRYAVLFAVQNVRDSRGMDSSDACEVLRNAVKTALIKNWQPTPNTEAMRYRGGQVIPVKGTQIYFFKAYYEVRVYE